MEAADSSAVEAAAHHSSSSAAAGTEPPEALTPPATAEDAFTFAMDSPLHPWPFQAAAPKAAATLLPPTISAPAGQQLGGEVAGDTNPLEESPTSHRRTSLQYVGPLPSSVVPLMQLNNSMDSVIGRRESVESQLFSMTSNAGDYDANTRRESVMSATNVPLSMGMLPPQVQTDPMTHEPPSSAGPTPMTLSGTDVQHHHQQTPTSFTYPSAMRPPATPAGGSPGAGTAGTRAPTRPPSTQSTEPKRDALAQRSRNVYIAWLPRSFCANELTGLGTSHGAVESVRLVEDLGRTYGFVLYQTHEHAVAAVEALNRVRLCNRKLQARLSATHDGSKVMMGPPSPPTTNTPTPVGLVGNGTPKTVSPTQTHPQQIRQSVVQHPAVQQQRARASGATQHSSPQGSSPSGTQPQHLLPSQSPVSNHTPTPIAAGSHPGTPAVFQQQQPILPPTAHHSATPPTATGGGWNSTNGPTTPPQPFPIHQNNNNNHQHQLPPPQPQQQQQQPPQESRAQVVYLPPNESQNGSPVMYVLSPQQQQQQQQAHQQQVLQQQALHQQQQQLLQRQQQQQQLGQQQPAQHQEQQQYAMQQQQLQQQQPQSQVAQPQFQQQYIAQQQHQQQSSPALQQQQLGGQQTLRPYPHPISSSNYAPTQQQQQQQLGLQQHGHGQPYNQHQLPLALATPTPPTAGAFFQQTHATGLNGPQSGSAGTPVAGSVFQPVPLQGGGTLAPPPTR